MKSRWHGFACATLSLATVAGLHTFAGTLHAAGPACACQSRGSCTDAGSPLPPYADGMEPPPVPDSDLADQYSLGEAAPAQTGTSLAMADNAGFMIGDLFANGYEYGTIPGNGVYQYESQGPISLAGGDRRFKISENTSPIPRDRLYFTYNHFHNALFTTDGRQLDLNRYTFGGEKTFLDGLGSVEVRLPFANGLASDQVQDGIDNDQDTTFGNVTIVPKLIVAGGDFWLVSAGLGINLPTAEDASLTIDPQVDVIHVENEAVHLSPFLGFYLSPSDETYIIGYLQADFDANGNTVSRTGLPLGGGVLQDQTLFHADVAIGRWIYRNESSRLTGIAPQLELHYTSTIQDADEVSGTIEPITNRYDLLTLTGGVNFQLYRSFLTLGCAVPLRGGDRHPEEHQFDAELQVLFNRFF